MNVCSLLKVVMSLGSCCSLLHHLLIRQDLSTRFARFRVISSSVISISQCSDRPIIEKLVMKNTEENS